MGIAETLALSLGSAWASGINLYAAVFMLGFMNANGYAELPPDLQVLSHPLVLVAAGIMYVIEFFADKMPGVDTGWDVVHSFIRIPAGAILAAGAVGDVGPGAEIAAALVGGSIAAGSHATKAGSRVLINTSPEPVSNWAASLGEDIAVVAGLWAALNHPWVFLVALALLLVAMAWVLPHIWRGIRGLFRRLGRLFGKDYGEDTARRLPPGGNRSP